MLFEYSIEGGVDATWRFFARASFGCFGCARQNEDSARGQVLDAAGEALGGDSLVPALLEPLPGFRLGFAFFSPPRLRPFQLSERCTQHDAALGQERQIAATRQIHQ
jgi:hypothetical protein